MYYFLISDDFETENFIFCTSRRKEVEEGKQKDSQKYEKISANQNKLEKIRYKY